HLILMTVTVIDQQYTRENLVYIHCLFCGLWQTTTTRLACPPFYYRITHPDPMPLSSTSRH
ncbi:unnamed protein product, partial [Mycena citricolor]